MRIVKLSKEVYGFDNINGCLAYFKHVLPWQKYVFNIVGEGHHIGVNSTNEDDIILFSYVGEIVCIAKVFKTNVEDNKVMQVEIKEKSIRFFKKRLSLKDLESELKNIGYKKNIVQARGWNIIDNKFEKEVINLLMKTDWDEYLI